MAEDGLMMVLVSRGVQLVGKRAVNARALPNEKIIMLWRVLMVKHGCSDLII